VLVYVCARKNNPADGLNLLVEAMEQPVNEEQPSCWILDCKVEELGSRRILYACTSKTFLHLFSNP
jgi:hypothetical protein